MQESNLEAGPLTTQKKKQKKTVQLSNDDNLLQICIQPSR